jgi:hypothetical protein
MSRALKYRKLRIAFSAVFGVLCLLLIVLWARSYYGEDRASGHISSVGIRFYSSRGWIVCFKNNAIGQGQYPWSIALGQDYWLAPSDSRLGFSLPVDFLGGSATSHISMPHWVIVLALMVLASIPWIGWKWRFSLRTLLIATTLVAVLLGLVVYVMSSR